MTRVSLVAPITATATRRKSSESAWPLRGADGFTFAERKAARTQESL